jgi:hypothetical protein
MLAGTIPATSGKSGSLRDPDAHLPGLGEKMRRDFFY